MHTRNTHAHHASLQIYSVTMAEGPTPSLSVTMAEGPAPPSPVSIQRRFPLSPGYSRPAPYVRDRDRQLSVVSDKLEHATWQHGITIPTTHIGQPHFRFIYLC